MVNTPAIAIIPARGASKRIPRKNIVDWFGKPMIAQTIEAALTSHLFSQVVVSTDDQEIADIAVQCGASVPFLRKKFADDKTAISQVTMHTIQELERRKIGHFNTVVQLMANCPLRTAADVSAAYQHFLSANAQFQISCVKFGWLNPWWAFTMDANHQAKYLFPAKLTQRSQDQPDLFCPTGAIWIANKTSLLFQKTFYGTDCTFFEIGWDHAIDIDTYQDLAWAKSIYAQQIDG